RLSRRVVASHRPNRGCRVTLFADDPGWMEVVDFLMKIVVVPCAVAVGGAFLLIQVLNRVEPPITRAWRRSALRAWYFTYSKAQCCLFAGLIGNTLEVLLCLPFLR